MIKIGWFSPALALVLSGCMIPAIPFDESSSPRPVPSVTQSPQKIDEDAFWAIVEDARARGQGDPDRMAAALDYRFYDANDETIRAFQEQLVAASMRLYTWRHGEAAELICGRLGPDEFTDWRSWVISLGRDTFAGVAANPDNIADVQDLGGGCAMLAESFGWAAFNAYWDRHQNADGLAELEPSFDPSGVQLHGKDAIRAALPKVAARA